LEPTAYTVAAFEKNGCWPEHAKTALVYRLRFLLSRKKWYFQKVNSHWQYCFKYNN